MGLVLRQGRRETPFYRERRPAGKRGGEVIWGRGQMPTLPPGFLAGLSGRPIDFPVTID
jgi:hypothetical protein